MKGNDRQRIESASLRTKYIWVAVITMSTIVYLIPYTYLDFYNHFLEAFQITDGPLHRAISLVDGWLTNSIRKGWS